MRVLLDTHAFLWWVADSPLLSQRAREVMSDGSNQLLLSAASAWEIAIKARLGKLTLPDTPARFVPAQLSQNAIDTLPVLVSHALHVFDLPDYHRDPFDRLLVAQSQLEHLPILTADAQIAQYAVDVLW